MEEVHEANDKVHTNRSGEARDAHHRNNLHQAAIQRPRIEP